MGAAGANPGTRAGPALEVEGWGARRGWGGGGGGAVSSSSSSSTIGFAADEPVLAGTGCLLTGRFAGPRVRSRLDQAVDLEAGPGPGTEDGRVLPPPTAGFTVDDTGVCLPKTFAGPGLETDGLGTNPDPEPEADRLAVPCPGPERERDEPGGGAKPGRVLPPPLTDEAALDAEPELGPEDDAASPRPRTELPDGTLALAVPADPEEVFLEPDFLAARIFMSLSTALIRSAVA